MRKWLVPLAILVAIALVAAFLFTRGGDESADGGGGGGDEETPLAVTRQAERRTLTRELQITGTLERIEVQTISVATPGNISDIAIEDGDRIDVGDVIFSLDGRPGIAVQGETPFFRDLDVGSRGPDVLQLETALADFGYDPGMIDELFTLTTRQALAQFQRDRNYPASSPEVGETVTVTLMSNPVAYTVGAQNTASLTIDPLLSTDLGPSPSSSSGRIVVEDVVRTPGSGGGTSFGYRQTTPPTVSIQTSTLVVAEGGSVVLTVVVDTAPTAPLTIPVTFSGTATAGTDFIEPVPAQVVIPVGATSASLTVQTIQDAMVEETDTLTIALTPDGSGSAYTVGSGELTIDISDDDRPTVNITGSGAVTEGETASFTVTVDQPVLTDTTVTLAQGITAGLGGGAGEATAGTDHESFASVVIIPAGETSVTVPIATFVDADVEGDEEISVEIDEAPGYRIGTQNAALILLQDGTAVEVPVITIEADDDETAEGGAATFTLRASNATSTPYDVNWSLGGSAVVGDDYDAPAQYVTTIGANAIEATLNLGLNDDDLIQPDRTLDVTLVPGPGYTLGSPTAASTLIEDGDSPELSITGTTVLGEGQQTTVTITADQPALEAIELPINVGGSAQSNADYEPLPTRMMMPAGITVVTLPVTVLSDASIEPDEEIVVTLGGGGGDFTVDPDADEARLTITDAIGTGVGPTLSITSSTAEVPEGQQVSFTINASSPSTREIDIDLSLGGTAVNNVDFTFPTQDFVLSPGQTQLQIPVAIRQDETLEPDSLIVVTLLDAPGYTVALPNRAETVIIDDDLPELTIATDTTSLAEGGEARFVIRADTAPPEPMSVNYQVSGSAQPGLDFETLSGTAILAAGQTELVIPLRTLNDDVIFRPTDMIAADWPGRAGKIFIEEGQSLVDGAPLFEVTEDEFSIRLSVSPNQRAELNVGMIADVEIEASDLDTVGEITELDENATIDANSGVESYEGRVDIPTDFDAVDGSQAQITIVVEEATDAVVVPVAAVFQNPDGDAVRVLNVDTGELNEVNVVTGLDEESFVEITSGLRAGELVIIEVN